MFKIIVSEIASRAFGEAIYAFVSRKVLEETEIHLAQMFEKR